MASALRDVLTRLDEGCVEYYLYPDDENSKDEAKLNELFLQVNVMVVSIIGEYIWQKDPFHLKLNETEGYFFGALRYDATVEDEWFTVHIMREVTQKFPFLIARIFDQDGEFLLIEASDCLPSWAESDEVCQQRVYIYQGNVHLIGAVKIDDQVEAAPCPLGNNDSVLGISQALELIRKYPTQTVANQEIQQVIDKRIGKYPEKMYENFHHVNVWLPPKAASILNLKPSIVSTAVRIFHYRDSIDMKTARGMPTFRPIEHLVKSRIRFTRTQYAMLYSQNFQPDLKVNWKLPPKTDPEYIGNSLGVKLTLGLEILIGRSQGHICEDLNILSNPTWLRYEQGLRKFNYYNGLLEGSRDYKILQDRAIDYFQRSVLTDPDFNDEDKIILELKTLLAGPIPDYTEESLHENDDDSWINIGVDDLDSLLEAQFKTTLNDHKLEEIPEKIKEFMSKMSDYTGVETSSTLAHDRSQEDDEEEDFEAYDDMDPVDFQATDFVTAMDKLLLELGKPNPDADFHESSSEEDEDIVVSPRRNSGLTQLMRQMDIELESTEVGKSFRTFPTVPQSPGNGKTTSRRKSTDEIPNSYTPVDIDMNALTNILESYQNQEVEAGPSSNLLRNVGFDMAKATKK